MNVAVVTRLFAQLALAAGVLAGLAVVWQLVARRSRGRLADVDQLVGAGTRLWLAWLVTAVATLGSLYYSEIVGFEPCRLCWFQRIAMYPLSLVLLLAAVRRDAHVRRYALPLAAIGAAVSTYHVVLQWFPQLESTSCDPAAPCAAFYVREFGFVSIPLMALLGFLAIVTALALPTDHPHRPTDTTRTAGTDTAPLDQGHADA